MGNSVVENLFYTEEVVGSNPAPSTKYAYDLGVIAALQKLAVSDDWIRARTQGGIQHRAIAQGRDAPAVAAVQGLEGATPAGRRQAVQQTAQAHGAAGRPSPIGGTGAELSPPKRPAAVPAAKASVLKGKLKPALLAGAGLGVGTMLAGSGDQSYR